MKKIVCLFLVFSVLCLSSCRGKYKDTYSIVTNFLDVYGVECITYSSLAEEGSAGYITPEIRKQLFTNEEILPHDYSIALHSRLDGVFELGVFLADDTFDRLVLSDMCLSRVKLLGSLSRGEGNVFIKNNLVIYIFSSDIENALGSLRRVL